MALTKEQKKERVAQYVDLLKKSKGIVMAEYGGLAATGMNTLRGKTREAQGEVHVVKNTLAAIALREAGLPDAADQVAGSTLIAFGIEDVVGVAKAVVDAAKASEFVRIQGGYMDGKPLSVDDVKMLAALPPLPQMRAQLAGLLKAPAGKIAGVLSAPARDVVGVCQAYARQQAAA
ncbi:MAG: 50S ribosomal protein L10 [Anaerolineales bacterium]